MTSQLTEHYPRESINKSNDLDRLEAEAFTQEKGYQDKLKQIIGDMYGFPVEPERV